MLEQIYLKKIANKQMPHLITLETQADEQETANEIINKWLINFMQSLINQNTNRNLQIENLSFFHSDFLLISTEKVNYQVDDFQSFFEFQRFRPLELPAKICVIMDAHKITPVVANKLLKTFEEPEVAMHIFICNPTKKKLLSTIQSRSIKGRIIGKEDRQNISIRNTALVDTRMLEEMLLDNAPESIRSYLIDFIYGRNNTYQVVESIKNDEEAKRYVENLPNEIACHFSLNAQQLNKLLENAKLMKTSHSYYNSFEERVFLVMSQIRDLTSLLTN